MNLNDHILSIDIGGSHIKTIILDREGNDLSSYEKVDTPSSGSPEDIIEVIQKLTKGFTYTKVSVGFPGYVKDGVVLTAPNLGTDLWKDFPFAKRLAEHMKAPVRLLNDADMQGLGIASGNGFEIVVTLGTGFGTALLMNGNLLPHLELAHHPITKKKDYDDYIGEKALEKIGTKRWNKRMQKVIAILERVFNYDHLFLGGGNAKLINFKLPDNISLVDNEDGIKGGAKLWLHDNHKGIISIYPTT